MIGLMRNNRSAESGGVIYWIFIAVALFAALSFAVSNINRGGSTGQLGELWNLRGADVMQYAGATQRAIRSMRINGIDESELCFHAEQWGHTDYEYNPPCADNGNRVFSTEGGGVSFQQSAGDWYDAGVSVAPDGGTWVFSGRYEVTDIGTDSGGAGTAAANADLIMASAPLRVELCEALNRLLNYTPSPPLVAAGTYNDLATNEFAGTFGSGAGRIGAHGRERCVAEDDGGGNPAHYIYYKVILAR